MIFKIISLELSSSHPDILLVSFSCQHSAALSEEVSTGVAQNRSAYGYVYRGLSGILIDLRGLGHCGRCHLWAGCPRVRELTAD